jgi:hypothetical protein
LIDPQKPDQIWHAPKTVTTLTWSTQQNNFDQEDFALK